MMLRRTKARRGAVLVESALIYPVLFLLVFATILLGVSVFRWQQMSHASREAARWASVHGQKYADEHPPWKPATASDVFDAASPYLAGIDIKKNAFTSTTDTTAGTITYTGTNSEGTITFAVTWNMNPDGTPDTRPTRVVQVVDPVTQLPKDVSQYNTVTVTITYTWDTGMFGVIPVSSTSVNTIFY